MNDAEIQRLIRVPKRISEPPSRNWRLDLAQKRKDFRLVSEDGQDSFRAFARQSLVFPENFSIGLEYEPTDGSDSVILLRCNGPHGDYNRAINPDHPHFHSHIHVATEAAMSAGERAEREATRTSEFVTSKEAVRYFLHAVNVDNDDQAQYFEEELTLTLFELGEGTVDAT
jgi:hypothetical protein